MVEPTVQQHAFDLSCSPWSLCLGRDDNNTKHKRHHERNNNRGCPELVRDPAGPWSQAALPCLRAAWAVARGALLHPMSGLVWSDIAILM